MTYIPILRHIKNPICIGHIIINENIIKQGTYNTIHKGTFNNVIVAIRMSILSWKKFIQELAILEKIDNSSNYIIHYYGWTIIKGKFALVLEYIENDLYEIINNENIEDNIKLRISKQILLGISDMHKNNFNIPDLKTENILIDKNYNIKLIDFDLHSLTYGLFPPERVGNDNPTKKGDIWLYGILIYILYKKICPYSMSSEYTKELSQKILPSFDNLPNNIKNICTLCIQYNPDSRPSIHELLQIFEKIE